MIEEKNDTKLLNICILHENTAVQETIFRELKKKQSSKTSVCRDLFCVILLPINFRTIVFNFFSQLPIYQILIFIVRRLFSQNINDFCLIISLAFSQYLNSFLRLSPWHMMTLFLRYQIYFPLWLRHSCNCWMPCHDEMQHENELTVHLKSSKTAAELKKSPSLDR